VIIELDIYSAIRTRYLDGESILGIIPVVVGGAAVEFYTLGQYATMDIEEISLKKYKKKQRR